MSLGFREAIISATTLASSSEVFEVSKDQVVTVSAYPDLSGGAAQVRILAGAADTTEYSDYLDGSGTAVQLSSDQNAVRLQGPAQYYVDKEATTGSTSAVYIQR